jgi:hypothetical protein
MSVATLSTESRAREEDDVATTDKRQPFQISDAVVVVVLGGNDINTLA